VRVQADWLPAKPTIASKKRLVGSKGDRARLSAIHFSEITTDFSDVGEMVDVSELRKFRQSKKTDCRRSIVFEFSLRKAIKVPGEKLWKGSTTAKSSGLSSSIRRNALTAKQVGCLPNFSY